MPRVLHLIDASDPQELRLALAPLLQRLNADRWTQFVAPLSGGVSHFPFASDFIVGRVPVRFGLHFLAAPALRRLLHKHRIDLIHAWSLKAAYVATLASDRMTPMAVSRWDPHLVPAQAGRLLALAQRPHTGILCHAAMVERRLVEHGVPIMQAFYDEDGTKLRMMRFGDIRRVDGRFVPHTWTMTPLDKPGHETRIELTEIQFDAELDDSIFTKRNLDEAALEELEELLIGAALGVATAAKLTANLARTRFDKEVAPEEVRRALAEDIAAILAPVATPLVLDAARKPHVVLVVGVNGSGKTTTIAKLAKLYRDQGLEVLLAAGDTFRAAAVEQLKIWGARSGCRVVAGAPGADAAGLAYEALEIAQKEGFDLLLIDTAGRLHNKADLMAELQKVLRVLKKLDPTAPHDTLLVLDATTGQNAHAQVETFKALAGVTGLALTKLDGSARGGVLVALAERFALPVHAVGVGEGLDDLCSFEARDFANSLMGIEG